MFAKVCQWSTTQLCKAAKGRSRALLTDGTEVFLLFWDPDKNRVRVQDSESLHHHTIPKERVQFVSTIWPGMNPSDLGVDKVTPGE